MTKCLWFPLESWHHREFCMKFLQCACFALLLPHLCWKETIMWFPHYISEFSLPSSLLLTVRIVPPPQHDGVMIRCCYRQMGHPSPWELRAPVRSGQVKALVWFWWIDETLNANLVYQSDHKIGSTIPSVEQMVKIMMMVWPWWWSCARAWKRRQTKIKSSRRRWYP